MGAFPSGSVSRENLNAGTDKPKDARTDLLDAVDKLNSILASYDDNSGICGLNSSGLIDSAKLQNVINTDQIVDHAVELDKLDTLATDRVLGRLSSGTGDVEAIEVEHELGTVASGHTTLVTAKAVKDYVDGQTSPSIIHSHKFQNFSDQQGGVQQPPTSSNYTRWINILNLRWTPATSTSKLIIDGYIQYKYERLYEYTDQYGEDYGRWEWQYEPMRVRFNGGTISDSRSGGKDAAYVISPNSTSQQTITFQMNIRRYTNSTYPDDHGVTRNFQVMASSLYLQDATIPDLSVSVTNA